MSEEVWKDVEWSDGAYSVSNLGRVRSNPRLDSVGRRVGGYLLKPASNKRGTYRCVLRRNGKTIFVPVSRLVAVAFLPGGGDDYQVRHFDGNRANNALSNLFWLHKNDDKGENNGFAKLSSEDVDQIRAMAAEGRTSAYIAEYFQIFQGYVRRIVTGEARKERPVMEDNSKHGERYKYPSGTSERSKG